jgi:hypothetical protein
MSHELCKAWLDSARADLKSIEYILKYRLKISRRIQFATAWKAFS